jgi:hypothetical protein
VLIEAIDRPRLLNDVTTIITEESESFQSLISKQIFLFLMICLRSDFEITSAHIATEHGVVKDRLAIRPVSFSMPLFYLNFQPLISLIEIWRCFSEFIAYARAD